MFAGLLIVVAGVEDAAGKEFSNRGAYGGHSGMAFFSAVLSNLVSNVPAVLVFRPLVASLPNAETAWLTLAMASTLAGNFTILASVANLIVVEKASRR
jgi:Na+/H+ antiporter NhaD/arsenite permease-like protein